MIVKKEEVCWVALLMACVIVMATAVSKMLVVTATAGSKTVAVWMLV